MHPAWVVCLFRNTVLGLTPLITFTFEILMINLSTSMMVRKSEPTQAVGPHRVPHEEWRMLPGDYSE